MKTIPAALSASKYRCHVWTINRTDGVRLGFTTADREITVDKVVCKPIAGAEASAIDQQSELAVSNLDVRAAFSDDAITESDLEAGRYDEARIDCWVTAHDDAEAAKVLMLRAFVGEIELVDGTYQIQLRSLAEMLQKPVGRVITAECAVDLGSPECGIDLEAITISGAVSNIGDPYTEFRDAGMAYSGVDHFAYGVVTFITGANAGIKREVKSSDNTNTITVWTPLPNPIAVGDTFTVYPGCNRTLATCIAKFNNRLNFRGYPHVPGTDKIMDYPDSHA